MDRLTRLLEQPRTGGAVPLTGIDFVRVVDPTVQTLLHVYFHIDPEELTEPFSATPVDPASIELAPLHGGPVPIADVRLETGDAGRRVLAVEVEAPGDFRIYRLTIDDARVDRFYSSVELSFKQGCVSDFDCDHEDPACPPVEVDPVALDLLARDFPSIREAMLALVTRRIPSWREPLEADVGVMVAEVLAAAGDELGYIQDRLAREAFFLEATHGRSLDRHARLVDFTPHRGLSASTLLRVDARPGGHAIPEGACVWAPQRAGDGPIPFEVGVGLANAGSGTEPSSTYWVHSSWNSIPIADIGLYPKRYFATSGSVTALPCHTEEIYLEGDLLADALPSGGIDPSHYWQDRVVLLASGERRARVTITEIERAIEDALGGTELTRLTFTPPLAEDLPLADARLHANLVPVTAGRTQVERCIVGSAGSDEEAIPVLECVERQGPKLGASDERSIITRYSPRQTERFGLGHTLPSSSSDRVDIIADPTPQAALRRARPEILIDELDPSTGTTTRQRWRFVNDLLDSGPDAPDFMVERGTWRRVVAHRERGVLHTFQDYASKAGFTVRFGDDTFGRRPSDGTVFQITYRTGPGRRANLPADARWSLEPPAGEAAASTLEPFAESVSNPFHILDGEDPESDPSVKELAPEAFRQVPLRAVTRADHARLAERLPWVQRAGAVRRWTGSWYTTFVTPDPHDSYTPTEDQLDELQRWMECVRLAGREVAARNPDFVDLDLEVSVCLRPGSHEGQVAEAIEALLIGPDAFFSPDHFTFGTPLRRSALEAAIQSVPGVLAVASIRVRARGRHGWRPFDVPVLEVGLRQVIRLQNDPRYPERGFLRVMRAGS